MFNIFKSTIKQPETVTVYWCLSMNYMIVISICLYIENRFGIFNAAFQIGRNTDIAYSDWDWYHNHENYWSTSIDHC